MERRAGAAPRGALLGLGLFAGVAALYLPSLANGFLYDDHEVVRVQAAPRGPADLARVFAEPHFHGLPYYRPVVRASLLAQKALHPEAPGAFRLANAGLAGAAAALAFALLRSPGLATATAPAALAAALWGVHPAMSSTVYPIASGRETLLPAVWMLAAALAWLHGRRRLGLVALALALFSKEQAVVVPALFAWADLCGVARGGRPAGLAAWARRYAPVAAVGIAWALVRRAVLGSSGIELAVDEDPLGPLLALAYSLQTAFAPTLGLVYEPEVHVWLSPARLAVAAAALLGLAALAWRVAAPPARVALFWAGWLVIAQLPTAHLVRQEAPFAERYTLLALLALPAFAAGIVSARWERPAWRRAATAAAALLVVAAGAVSLARAPAFSDDRRFALRWLETNPHSPDAHHLFGLVRLQEGDPSAAIAHLREARARSTRTSEIDVNLAAALVAQGRRGEARARLEDVVAAEPDHPEAHLDLGRLLLASEPERAVAMLERAVALAPRSADARTALGLALASRGRGREAAPHLAEAWRLRPGDPRVRRALERLERAEAPGR